MSGRLLAEEEKGQRLHRVNTNRTVRHKGRHRRLPLCDVLHKVMLSVERATQTAALRMLAGTDTHMRGSVAAEEDVLNEILVSHEGAVAKRSLELVKEGVKYV